jgi:hypothetical protein
VTGKPAPVVQTAPEDVAERRLALQPRDRRANGREARAADVDRGDAIGSTNAFSDSRTGYRRRRGARALRARWRRSGTRSPPSTRLPGSRP